MCQQSPHGGTSDRSFGWVFHNVLLVRFNDSMKVLVVHHRFELIAVVRALGQQLSSHYGSRPVLSLFG
jgi:hypothetical protein